MMVSRDEQASNQTWGLTPGALPVGVRFSQTQNLSLRISFLVQFLLGQEKENGGVLTSVPVANMSFPYSQSQLPLPLVMLPMGSVLVDFIQHQAAMRG